MAIAKKPRFRTYLNNVPVQGEVNNSPSLTKPGKSLSLAEVIRRDQADLLSPGDVKQPVYFENEIIRDFRMMDTVDIVLWREQLEELHKIASDKVDAELAERKRLQDEKEAAEKAKSPQSAD